MYNPRSLHSEISITSDTRCNSNPNAVITQKTLTQNNELNLPNETYESGGGDEMNPNSSTSSNEKLLDSKNINTMEDPEQSLN